MLERFAEFFGAATSITQYQPGLYMVTAVAVAGLITSATALLRHPALSTAR